MGRQDGDDAEEAREIHFFWNGARREYQNFKRLGGRILGITQVNLNSQNPYSKLSIH